MTEKEKMLNGELYDANYDENLLKERIEAKELCFQYNHINPSKIEERKNILHKLIGKTKDKFYVEQYFWCDYGYNIE